MIEITKDKKIIIDGIITNDPTYIGYALMDAVDKLEDTRKISELLNILTEHHQGISTL